MYLNIRLKLVILIFFHAPQHPMIANGDRDIANEKKKFLANVLSRLNKSLEDNEWFAGDSPTLADMFILSNVTVIMVMTF